MLDAHPAALYIFATTCRIRGIEGVRVARNKIWGSKGYIEPLDLAPHHTGSVLDSPYSLDKLRRVLVWKKDDFEGPYDTAAFSIHDEVAVDNALMDIGFCIPVKDPLPKSVVLRFKALS